MKGPKSARPVFPQGRRRKIGARGNKTSEIDSRDGITTTIYKVIDVEMKTTDVLV